MRYASRRANLQSISDMKLNTDMKVNRITDEIWEIPMSEKPGMLVPARIYATQGILQTMDSGSLRPSHQCRLFARHPPICALYAGWPLGLWISDRRCCGVRSLNDGIISPGGVGYDINCGMRLIRTDLTLGGRAAPPGAAHDRTLSKSAGWRRGERIRSALARKILVAS